MGIVLKLLILGILFQTPVFADGVVGEWLLGKVEVKDEIQESFADVEFGADGSFIIMGINFGAYTYQEGSKEFKIQSDIDEDIAGSYTVLSFNDKELVLQKNKIPYKYKIHFLRINHTEIALANKSSNLAGTWELQTGDGSMGLVTFELPDTFLYSLYEEDVSTKIRGMWIYDAKAKSIMIAAQRTPLSGENKIKYLDEKGLMLTQGAKEIKALKKTPLVIERLNFTEEDIPEGSAPELPHKWTDFTLMAESLSDIEFVQYRIGTLLNGVDLMRYSSFRSLIEVTPKPSVTFTNFTMRNGAADEQFSQQHKGGLSNSYNNFFPQEEMYTYKTPGREKLKVLAGEFMCTVFEGILGDDKVRLWMIDDKPGIYAKKITESLDPFGELSYRLEELETIQLKKEK
ncbi:hypothetical protein KJ877_06095 [bacterium]|nr:hypothetical protein [bacterium]MBU1989756.1 hypothetical protein [bacterium]